MTMTEPKRMSQRKKRQIEKRPPEETLFEEVQEATLKWNVLSVEKHYAGYWDELGFRVDVSAEATAEDMLEMGNALLALMESSPTAAKLPGTWIIGIYRGDDLVRVVAPGDKPWFICADCGLEQQEWSDRCLQCGALR